jgi:hypothetical protein
MNTNPFEPQRELTDQQTSVMMFIQKWANVKKTPIPQADIIKSMQAEGIKSYSTLYAINALLAKGYIRRAVTSYNNKTFYVMCRTIEFEE